MNRFAEHTYMLEPITGETEVAAYLLYALVFSLSTGI